MGENAFTVEWLERHRQKLVPPITRLKGVMSSVHANAVGLSATGGVTHPPTNTSKFRSRKTEVDGIVFDSSKEARRWQELRLLESAGAILYLERQVAFDLIASNGEVVAKYYADFRYKDLALNKTVVEDTKSDHTRTLPVYRLKKKLMMACHGITITEV